MSKLRILVLMLVSGIIVTDAHAQTSTQQRAQQLEKLEEDLNSPNPNVRLAALESAMQSSSPALRTKAISIGLSSSDPNLFQMAFRYKVCESKNFSISTQYVQDSNYKFDMLAKGMFTLRIISCDPVVGTAVVTHNIGAADNSGTITFASKSINLDLVFKRLNGDTIGCTALMKLKADLLASGTMACSMGSRSYGPAPIQIDFE